MNVCGLRRPKKRNYMSLALCLRQDKPMALIFRDHYHKIYKMHLKKRLLIFPYPAGMSQTKLPLAIIIKLFPARESLVSDTPVGDV
jgi:hypothetical protein